MLRIINIKLNLPTSNNVDYSKHFEPGMFAMLKSEVLVSMVLLMTFIQKMIIHVYLVIKLLLGH